MAEPELGQVFCGMSASALAEAARGNCRWTHSPVSVAHQMALPAANITAEQIDRIFIEVAALWSSVCGIDLRFQADPNANILARVEAMDGPNGVLGESYLPCGNVNPRTQLTQRYDTGERWTINFLKRVILHEVGHALGLDHAPQGSAVMSPYLTDFAVPQPWDVEQMVARYGPPKPIVVKPTDPPVTPPPTGDPPVDLFAGRDMRVPSGAVIHVPAAGAYLFRVGPAKVRGSVNISMTPR